MTELILRPSKQQVRSFITLHKLYYLAIKLYAHKVQLLLSQQICIILKN